MTNHNTPQHTDQNARERLLCSAISLFTRKGYSATTVQEIVETAGVTKPILYYYFGNKEGIYLHLIDEVHQTFLGLIDSFKGFSGSTLERLTQAVEAFYDLAIQNLDVVRLLHVIFYGPPQGAPFVDIHSFHTRLFEAYLNIVTTGIESGDIRPDPEYATHVVMAIAHLAVDSELAQPESPLGKEGLKKLLNIVFQGIALPRTQIQEVL